MTLIAHLSTERLFDEARNARQNSSEVATHGGLESSDRHGGIIWKQQSKEVCGYSQRTGGNVRSRLLTVSEQNKIVRLTERFPPRGELRGNRLTLVTPLFLLLMPFWRALFDFCSARSIHHPCCLHIASAFLEPNERRKSLAPTQRRSR